MKNIELFRPKFEDFWFRQQCLSDPETMNYNAGYDVHYSGYHYDTGCIDFPKEKWQSWVEEKLGNANFFYAYILDKDENVFVGYVNYNMNSETKKRQWALLLKLSFRDRVICVPH